MANWYNLNIGIIDYVLPRLKEFKDKNVNSHPAEYKSIEEWHKAIDEMLFALNEVRNETEASRLIDDYMGKRISESEYHTAQDALNVRITKGLELFGRSIPDLWD